MLIVNVTGGLGNQLFQYAFYEFLKLNNDNVVLDLSSFQRQSYHYGFELDKVFDLKYDILSKSPTPFFYTDNSKIFYRIIHKLFDVFIKKKFDFYGDDSISLIRKEKFDFDMYFNGFWQDAYYVQEVKDFKTKILNFRLFDLSKKNKELKEYINNNFCVAVHIRRGDYLNYSYLNEICNKQYYDQAIQYFKNKYNFCSFVFFSDDILWCKEKFKEIKNSIFVDWNTKDQSYLDLYMMSLCQNNIIANSTFSWWGAYLNNNNEKIVICPKFWNQRTLTNHLICPGWIAL